MRRRRIVRGIDRASPFHGAEWRHALEHVRSQEPVPPSRLQPQVPRDLETMPQVLGKRSHRAVCRQQNHSLTISAFPNRRAHHRAASQSGDKSGPLVPTESSDHHRDRIGRFGSGRRDRIGHKPCLHLAASPRAAAHKNRAGRCSIPAGCGRGKSTAVVQAAGADQGRPRRCRAIPSTSRAALGKFGARTRAGAPR